MAGFLFRLETVEGEPAEPPTLSAAVRGGTGERVAGFGGTPLRPE